MHQPQRIIIRSPNWLGDQIMALKCYQQIRLIFPKSHLVCWYPAGFQGVIPKGIFDEEWEFAKSELKNPQKTKEWIQKINQAQFDLSINLNASWSSALLFFRARIPQRIGFSESGSRLLMTRALAFRGVKTGLHKSDIYLSLLKLIDKNFSPQIQADPPKKNPAPRANYWVIAPGAALPLREWPYFPELIFEIKKRYPNQCLKIVGTTTELVWKTRLARWNLPGIEDWVERTTIPQLKELCSQAQLVLANDSGVAHLAATLAGVPTLVLFGPGNPGYIAPQGPRVVPIRAEPSVSCSPCEKPYCRAPEGYQKCLKDISVASVLREIESVIAL